MLEYQVASVALTKLLTPEIIKRSISPWLLDVKINQSIFILQFLQQKIDKRIKQSLINVNAT